MKHKKFFEDFIDNRYYGDLHDKLEKMDNDDLIDYIKSHLTEEGDELYQVFINDKDFWNGFSTPYDAIQFRDDLMCNPQGGRCQYSACHFIVMYENNGHCESYSDDSLFYLITECTDLINYLN